jgi:DHA1 family tetracycline resistance protein-like MFS transporter
MVLSLLSPFSLMLMQLYVSMSPMWYYMASPVSSLVSWSAVTLSSLSDVIPPKWRAPSFGLLLASFMLGFALSPLLAVTLSHWSISIISLLMHIVILVFAVFFLPETLPPCARRRQNKSEDLMVEDKQRKIPSAISVLLAPFQELSILNRSYLFRLLSALAFFSGMVSSADQSLLVYYAEDQLNFNDHDIATMFALFGILGIVIQGVVMKILNDCLGERRVVIVAFTFGVVHNIIYGLATSKCEILVGVALGCFVSMSFPTISAMKSNNVGKIEQGRIQGALASLSSLASAIGPASLRLVYHLTSDTKYPGSMFLFASFLYLIAVLCAIALPDVVTEHNEINEIYLKVHSLFDADDPTNLDDSFNSCSSYHNYGSLEILKKPLLTDMQLQNL